MPLRFWPGGKGAPAGPVPRPPCAQEGGCVIRAENNNGQARRPTLQQARRPTMHVRVPFRRVVTRFTSSLRCRARGMRDVYRSTAGLSISLRDYRRLAGLWERALNELIAALGDEQRPVGCDSHPDLRSTGRPANLNAVDLFRLADAEVEGERTLGIIAPAAYDIGDLLAAGGFDRA